MMYDLAKHILDAIHHTLLLLRFDGTNFILLFFRKPIVRQFVSKFKGATRFSQLRVGPAAGFIQPVEISVQTARNAAVQLFLGNSRKNSIVSVPLGQGGRSIVALETSARIPHLKQI